MNRWIRTRGVSLVTIFAILWLGWVCCSYWIGNRNANKDLIQSMANDISLFDQFQIYISGDYVFNTKHFCNPYTSREELRNSSREPARKFRNIALIKVYKAASSTLSNIIYRYGYNRGMDFILPQEVGVNQIFPNSPSDENAKVIPLCTKGNIHQTNSIANNGNNVKYQLLNVHTLFRGKSHLLRLLPNDTFIVSSVRDPVNQIKSAFGYNGFERRLKQHQIDFYTFFESPYANTIQFLFNGNETNFRKGADWGLWNPQSLVHGLSEYKIRPGITRTELLSDPEQMGIVYEFLNSVEREIHLSVIADKFEESIVIMRNLLGLQWEDVVYLESNKGLKGVSKIDTIERKNIIEWNYIDFLLYEKMKEKFYRIKDELGRELIAREVETLSKYNERIANTCLSHRRFLMRRGRYVNYLEFDLSRRGILNECCHQITAQEWTYIPQLKEYMWRKCN